MDDVLLKIIRQLTDEQCEDVIRFIENEQNPHSLEPSPAAQESK